MSKLYNVGGVGATGLVGQEFLRIAMQRGFPIKDLRLLASSRSAGRRVTVGEWELEVEETTTKSFSGVDIAFFSATTEVSKQIIPAAVKAGAVVNFPAIDVKLNGVIAITKPSSGRWSS